MPAYSASSRSVRIEEAVKDTINSLSSLFSGRNKTGLKDFLSANETLECWELITSVAEREIPRLCEIHNVQLFNKSELQHFYSSIETSWEEDRTYVLSLAHRLEGQITADGNRRVIEARVDGVDDSLKSIRTQETELYPIICDMIDEMHKIRREDEESKSRKR